MKEKQLKKVIPSLELLGEMESLVVRGGYNDSPLSTNPSCLNLNCDCTKTVCDCTDSNCGCQKNQCNCWYPVNNVGCS